MQPLGNTDGRDDWYSQDLSVCPYCAHYYLGSRLLYVFYGMALCQMPDLTQLFINKTKLFKLWRQGKAGRAPKMNVNVNVNQMARQTKPVSCLEILKTLTARQVKHYWNQYLSLCSTSTSFLERGKKGRKYQTFAITFTVHPVPSWISILLSYWCHQIRKMTAQSFPVFRACSFPQTQTVRRLLMWIFHSILLPGIPWYRPNFNIWVAGLASDWVVIVLQTI